jgi:aspartate/methionine/tyrosine aminotransferase
MQTVQSPIIPVVAELIKDHPGTISLGQGVVYYGPPPEAAEQWNAFLADPENHKYKPVGGIPALVDALKAKVARENRIAINGSNELIVTAGGNMAFMNAILAIADPGDEVILQTPYYFNHEMAVVMAGCRPVLVPTDKNYQLQPELIEKAITARTRAVVTISPNNPTGAVYPAADLEAVNRLCRERGIYHIHDEAYEYFTFAGASHVSPGSLPESAAHTISLFSFSKAYGFASWRIGYMVVPEHLVVAVRKIQDTILICPPVVSQFAAVGALKAGADYCRSKIAPLSETREAVIQKLADLQPLCSAPQAEGAFYFLLRLKTDRDPLEIVTRLVVDHRVAVIPGTAFGMEHGCYLRLAYGALQKETIALGIDRFVSGLQQILR